MGMYTQLNIQVELRPSTPDEVIATLKYLVGDSEVCTPEATKLDRMYCSKDDDIAYRFLLGSSYYFDPPEAHSYLEFDDVSKTYYLSVLADIKNYAGTWEAFLRWLAPYVEKSCHYIGTIRYEGDSLPTLIVMDKGKAFFHFIGSGYREEITLAEYEK